jgi:pimeloyl-ACP methyl ester carboxylesterase
MFEKWMRPRPAHDRPKESGESHVEHPLDPAFESQFAALKHINVCSKDDPEGFVSEECAEVVHVVPPHPRDTPIVLAPGYLSPIKEYKSAIHELYAHDQEVVSLNYPKKGSYLDLTDEQVQRVKEYFDPSKEDEVRKAIALLKVLDHEDLSSVNVIAHSAGAVDAAIAALLDPQRIKNIVFFCPAGLVDQNRRRLLSGLRKHVNDSRSESNWFSEAKRRPLSALAEGLGLMGVDIHKLIRALHENGVGLFVVSGDEDPIFPTDVIMNFMKKDIDEGLIDGFATFKGGHGNIERYMTEALKILGQLEQEKKHALAPETAEA